MGTLVSGTSSLLGRWLQLDPFYRKVVTWLVVFLMLVLTLSIMASLNPAGDGNAEAAATTTTTTRTATPVATQTVVVATVVDGRTIIGADGEQVVVEDLGQPGQCWAEAALNFAKITLLGKEVQVDAEMVRLPDGEDFAVLMAGRGLGRRTVGARAAVGDAQEMAKLAHLGLWAAPCEGSDAAPPSSSSPPPTVDGTSVPSPAPTSAVVAARYEAETSPALCSGTIDTNWPGYSGAGFCNSENAVGAYAQFTVTSSATVVIRFANGAAAGRPADIFVNGAKVQSVVFEATGAWSAWVSKTLTIRLPEGGGTIGLAATTPEGLPNIDYAGTADAP